MLENTAGPGWASMLSLFTLIGVEVVALGVIADTQGVLGSPEIAPVSSVEAKSPPEPLAQPGLIRQVSPAARGDVASELDPTPAFPAHDALRAASVDVMQAPEREGVAEEVEASDTAHEANPASASAARAQRRAPGSRWAADEDAAASPARARLRVGRSEHSASRPRPAHGPARFDWARERGEAVPPSDGLCDLVDCQQIYRDSPGAPLSAPDGGPGLRVR